MLPPLKTEPTRRVTYVGLAFKVRLVGSISFVGCPLRLGFKISPFALSTGVLSPGTEFKAGPKHHR